MKTPRDISPDFDDYDYERILQWGEVQVIWDEDYFDSTGARSKAPDELKSWSLGWKYGGISLDGIPQQEEAKARKAAALFVALWTRGIDPAVAERCAIAYVLHYNVERLK